MKTLLRAALFAGLVAAVLLAACWAGWWFFGGPGQAVTLTINDNGVTLPLTASGWAVAGAGALVSALVVLVVVPLALLIGFGVPAVILAAVLGLGLLLVFGAVALACAPLLLPALLVVWLVRRDRRTARRASTTIA